jgi:3-hydroxyacyl-[acyl-carrier-protein] dehydratase
MLLNSFYTVEGRSEVRSEETPSGIMETRFVYRISLNPDHTIYAGHFPGSPVVPGVCQIEMIREMIGLSFKKNVTLDGSDTIKFLSLIVPEMNPVLDFAFTCREIDANKTSASVAITSGEKVFLKFKGVFSLQS